MSGNADDPLLSVAGKISNGVPVDWKELQDQIATPDQAAVAEELRSLERYARVNEAGPCLVGPLPDHRANRCRHVRRGLSRHRAYLTD